MKTLIRMEQGFMYSSFSKYKQFISFTYKLILYFSLKRFPSLQGRRSRLCLFLMIRKRDRDSFRRPINLQQGVASDKLYAGNGLQIRNMNDLGDGFICAFIQVRTVHGITFRSEYAPNSLMLLTAPAGNRPSG